MEVGNAQAYYDTETITAVKRFYNKGPKTQKVFCKFLTPLVTRLDHFVIIGYFA